MARVESSEVDIPDCGAVGCTGPAEIAALEAEVDRLLAYADGETDKLRDALRRLDSALVLDEATLADLDKRATIHGTDRAGYLHWVLTGKEARDAR